MWQFNHYKTNGSEISWQELLSVKITGSELDGIDVQEIRKLLDAVELGYMEAKITHPVLGRYDQYIYDDIKDAGHVDLASLGQYGWEMPQDLPTLSILGGVRGKTILDLGCGWGNNVVIPAVEAGASEVYALDVTALHLDEHSPMRLRANALNYKRLQPTLLSDSWWLNSPLSRPSIGKLLKPTQARKLPTEGSVDVITARHVLHFGTPAAIMNVLDFVSAALAPGGRFSAINFTPYTEYMFRFDQGETLRAIIVGNKEYEHGEATFPSGYLSQNNRHGISLAALLNKPALEGKEFLYFDEPTLRGLLRSWASSRKDRGLPTDLEIEQSYYFSPTQIATFNKMTSEEYKEKENHFFTLVKK